MNTFGLFQTWAYIYIYYINNHFHFCSAHDPKSREKYFKFLLTIDLGYIQNMPIHPSQEL